MLKIIPIPVLKDNYIWVGINFSLGQVFIVDPGDASTVIDFLKKQNLTLTAILVTHKHADHTGGIGELLNTYKDSFVYAHSLENVSLATHVIESNQQISISLWPDAFTAIHIPGHTLGHVAYYAKGILFSGDTLFAAGCGRVFEGTAAQMLTSLNKLAVLPDDTLIYSGHEYTLANLRFALKVEPNNEAIKQRIIFTEKLRLDGHPSLPSTIGLEKKTNPFLRCTQQVIISNVENYANKKLSSIVDVFHELREWKNNF
jgi:hydroxyacylglutathione hydrolase